MEPADSYRFYCHEGTLLTISPGGGGGDKQPPLWYPNCWFHSRTQQKRQGRERTGAILGDERLGAHLQRCTCCSPPRAVFYCYQAPHAPAGRDGHCLVVVPLQEADSMASSSCTSRFLEWLQTATKHHHFLNSLATRWRLPLLGEWMALGSFTLLLGQSWRKQQGAASITTPKPNTHGICTLCTPRSTTGKDWWISLLLLPTKKWIVTLGFHSNSSI